MRQLQSVLHQTEPHKGVIHNHEYQTAAQNVTGCITRKQ